MFAPASFYGPSFRVSGPSNADWSSRVVLGPSIKEGHPVLELQIPDPKKRIALWGSNQRRTPRTKNRDTNFERALARFMQDIRVHFARADSPEVS